MVVKRALKAIFIEHRLVLIRIHVLCSIRNFERRPCDELLCWQAWELTTGQVALVVPAEKARKSQKARDLVCQLVLQVSGRIRLCGLVGKPCDKCGVFVGTPLPHREATGHMKF